jgi:ADP-dependent NAD(P)H-hydrate dehydratase / NAD(P)H-hydrate epimerase
MFVSVHNDPALWQTQLPALQPRANKYSRGHVLIAGGYPMTGAARLAARAAARMGAGLVSIAVPEMATPVYAGALLSIMVRPLATPCDFNALMGDSRISAMLIGSGIAPSIELQAKTLAMLATHKPVVIDAGALMAFAHHPMMLWNAIHHLRGDGPVTCVLTPHNGEFNALFGELNPMSSIDERLVHARDAAHISGAIVILKGVETLIAHPNGQAILNAHPRPNLATAGAGDVLGGIVAGLLAQGMPAFAAAAAAVWLHGAAADLFGAGLMAEDLPDLLPRALRAVQT